jgi:DNA-binding LacI/PurR family transcriptional regulator
VFIDTPSRDLCRSLAAHGVHYVLQFSPAADPGNLPPSHWVYVNKYAGAFNATEYLLRLGHRRIGCIGAGVAPPGTSLVFQGFAAALARAGLATAPEDLLECHAEHPAIVSGPAREYLRRPGRPTAILASNDATALGALDAALSLGLRVPEDLSVVGYNAEPIAATAPVPLTTITNPRRLQARVAVELLMEVAEGKHAAPQIRALDSFLVIRKSAGPPPAQIKATGD